MRVLFLQKTTDAQGGSKASLRNTLRALSELPDLELELCGEARGPLSAFVEELSIPFHQAPFPRWRNLLDRLRFTRTMKFFASDLGEIDWVISNEMWWAPHAVEIVKSCGAKSAVIVRDEIADLKKAGQYKFNRLDRIITVSEDLKSLLKDDQYLYDRTQTVYNIVERPEADIDTTEALKQNCLEFPRVKKWVLSAGTICPRKDQSLLIKALADLVRRGDRSTGVMIVGGTDGSEYATILREEIRDLNLEDRVLFTGQISGIGSALEIADAKVLTSHSEGLPRVLIESALSEVPSISTKVSGVNEVYGEYSDQFVMKSRDPIELADKLECLFDSSDEDSISKMKLRAENRFGTEAHLKDWREILEID